MIIHSISSSRVHGDLRWHSGQKCPPPPQQSQPRKIRQTNKVQYVTQIYKLHWIWASYGHRLILRHQFFRTHPATLSKNRIWTRSLVKLGRYRHVAYLMSTCPSSPSESVQTLFFSESAGGEKKKLVWRWDCSFRSFCSVPQPLALQMTISWMWFQEEGYLFCAHTYMNPTYTATTYACVWLWLFSILETTASTYPHWEEQWSFRWVLL